MNSAFLARAMPARRAGPGAPLPPRLAMIADELASRGRLGTVYDIGTDHAKLPIWLLRNGICSGSVATDIREAPLMKAARNVELAGLSGAVRFALCDGMAGIGGFDPGSAVVAAGMGGATLAGILERGAGAARLAGLVALQPMNNHATLRRKLSDLGYCVLRERVAVDGARVYVAIFCRWRGAAPSYSPAELAIGKGEPIGTREARRRYLRFARKIAQNRHGGLTELARARGLSACESAELDELEGVLGHIDARAASLDDENGCWTGKPHEFGG